MTMSNGLNEDAFFGLAGNERRADLATFDEAFARGHIEPTHASFRMARQAIFDEDRADAIFEELARLRLVSGGDGGRNGEQGNKQP